MANDGVHDPVNTGRRRFLTATTAVVGAVGVGFTAVPFIKSWNPSARAKLAGAPVVADISALQEGQRLVMAGGGTSWQDLALYLIARLVNLEAAMQMARLYLIDWHESGQQPFARLSASRQSDDAVITRCQLWVADHYGEPSPVAAMTRLSGLAERSFVRRFQQATGLSPLQYVHHVRLEEAKQLLEGSEDSIEAIAGQVGYEDAGYFARLFKREVNLTPAQYRRRFAGLREVLQQGRTA